MPLYGPHHIQSFYDRYGERETRRWNKSIVEQVKLFVHRHYLHRYMEQGDQLPDLELRAFRSPGMVEAGTHLIAVVSRK